jgi:hypothetical protein
MPASSMPPSTANQKNPLDLTTLASGPSPVTAPPVNVTAANAAPSSSSSAAAASAAAAPGP